MVKTSCIVFLFIGVAAATSLVFHSTQHARIYYFQGVHQFQKNHFEEALPLLHKAMSARPYFTEADRLYGYAAAYTRRYDQAIAAFERVIARNPQEYGTKKMLAAIYSWEKNYTASVKLYEGLYREKRDSRILIKWAEVLLWDKQYSVVQELLKDYVATHAEDVRAKILLAKAYQFGGNTKEAIILYEDIMHNK